MNIKKTYRVKNKDDINEKERLRYNEKKEEINEKQKQYRAENKDAINERKKLYRKKIKDAKEHEVIICQFLANIVN